MKGIMEVSGIRGLKMNVGASFEAAEITLREREDTITLATTGATPIWLTRQQAFALSRMLSRLAKKLPIEADKPKT